MDVIDYFPQMLFCLQNIECCSSLSRICPWYLIRYCKWVFPLVRVLCNNSLPGGHDEWRHVAGGFRPAERMCGHRLLGSCRYCFNLCSYGDAELLPKTLQGTDLTLESKRAFGLKMLYPTINNRFAFLTVFCMPLSESLYLYPSGKSLLGLPHRWRAGPWPSPIVHISWWVPMSSEGPHCFWR